MPSASWPEFRDNGTTNLPESFVVVGARKRLLHSSYCVVLGREWNSSTVQKRCSCAMLNMKSLLLRMAALDAECVPLKSIPIQFLRERELSYRQCIYLDEADERIFLFQTTYLPLRDRQTLDMQKKKHISRPFHEKCSMYRVATFSVILGKIKDIFYYTTILV